MSAKRIYRNQREKILGGVAAGIADYFDIDVAWVRLAFVLSIFVHGIGLIAYIIAWIVFPRDERTGAQIEQVGRSAAASLDAGVKKAQKGLSSGSRNAVGVVLILLGALFFLDQNFYWFRFDSFWPLLLVGLGIYMIMRAAQPDEDAVPIEAQTAAGPPASASDDRGSAEESDRA